MPFYVYKTVIQLFFINYTNAKRDKIASYKKILNELQNICQQEFESYQNRRKVANKENFEAFLSQYESDKDDFLIVGNAFLTILRAQALQLDFQDGV